MIRREVTKDEIILVFMHSNNFCLGFSISFLTHANNRAVHCSVVPRQNVRT